MDTACGRRWGTLTRWHADAWRADADQRNEEKRKKKSLTWVLRMSRCRRVDAFVLGRALRMRVDTDSCKEEKKNIKHTWSPAKVDADMQMCCVCVRMQMSIKKGQKKNKENTYLEITGWGWGRVAC